MKKIALILSVTVIFAACSGSSDKTKSTSEKPLQKTEAVVQASASDFSDHPGLPLYKQYCLPCHQADGNGVPGMFPTLHDTKWVNGDIAELVSIVDNGMDQEIEVNGEYFNTIMAPIPGLSDKELADILTFIRKKFGTDASEVSPEEVKKIRSKG